MADGSVCVEDQPLSKVSVNKYDPFQLKGFVDEEVISVSLIKIYSSRVNLSFKVILNVYLVFGE